MSNDPTTLPEWAALTAHQRAMERVTIGALFDAHPRRFEDFSVTLPGLLFDYSKHRVSPETLGKLCALARACKLEDRRTALFEGQAVNATENRAALHMALRGSCPPGLRAGGEDVGAFVTATLEKIRALSEKIRRDPDITDVIHIGIGGSDLGPRLVCRALAPLADGPRLHFLPNIDGQAFSDLARALDPARTMLIVVSKTFTTSETLSNARTAQAWLARALPPERVGARLVAVTVNVPAARALGVPEDHILPLRDWIGGRFSLWSAVGLPIAIALGFENFQRLLEGARIADDHFMTAPLERNIPVVMGLLGVWYRNFWEYPAHAVLPYAQNLEFLIPYLQQLDMESNGKPAAIATGPIVFGDVGTNAQHAFMQLLHQSGEIVPADFILIARPEHDLHAHHVMLLANGLAQSKALMDGRADPSAPHHHFEGNRPSSTFVLDRLDARALGLLLALYEHKIFVQGAIWGINSFDQWGVELGKTIARDLIEHFDDRTFDAALDRSTAGLLERLRQKFTHS